jgi:hypothetical protein
VIQTRTEAVGVDGPRVAWFCVRFSSAVF